MKKNKFITSTVILIIGSILTKFINMGIRILVSRVIGSVGMGVYMLVVPIFSLFISLSQMGLPVAISKLVSEKRNNNKNIIVSATITIMIFNFFLLAIIFLTASYISNYLLQDERTYKAIISMALVLPFISISSILRGYYFGKQRMQYQPPMYAPQVRTRRLYSTRVNTGVGTGVFKYIGNCPLPCKAGTTLASIPTTTTVATLNANTRSKKEVAKDG